eukprot:CAMPEP_0181387884 /NCGR_PEP_ID=MMETSP1106-20121128/23985_1 /TAXON_ID=81844 /ORGANISM="Mantoniella antarctica, Strain SL-175" /LENGTH=179 /DNA_ID=CAMNT_0023508349 /DNA_START=1 /DNA_END=541 /DNA_ORIENTATION=+
MSPAYVCIELPSFTMPCDVLTILTNVSCVAPTHASAAEECGMYRALASDRTTTSAAQRLARQPGPEGAPASLLPAGGGLGAGAHRAWGRNRSRGVGIWNAGSGAPGGAGDCAANERSGSEGSTKRTESTESTPPVRPNARPPRARPASTTGAAARLQFVFAFMYEYKVIIPRVVPRSDM